MKASPAPPAISSPKATEPFRLASALAEALKRKTRAEVRFDDGSRALYATDSSNYRQVPIGVVVPRDEEDVLATIQLCQRFGAPITSRGAGTSLAGQCCNVAVILDFSKYMNRLLELNPDKKLARFQPGLVLDGLRDAAEVHHLTFGSDTSTHKYCTMGGVLGNNACGVHSVMGQFLGNGPRTSDNVHELEIVTYDGLRMTVGATTDQQLERIIREGGRRAEIYGKLKVLQEKYAPLIRQRFPKIPRRVSGYNLDDLLPENGFHIARALVGTEGTCVTILQGTVHLIPSPPARVLLVLGYRDIYSAGDHVPEVMGFQPTGLEAVDDVLVESMRKKGMNKEERALLPDGNSWLLVEFGGASTAEAEEKARGLMRAISKDRNAPAVRLLTKKAEQEKIWEVRESGLGATARVAGQKDAWEGWEDAAVPPEKLGEYLRDFRALLKKFGYGCALYGHFGQGCVHTRIDFGLKTKEGIRQFRSFVNEAADLVVHHGGSLSGEHGDGQARAELLPKMYGPELIAAFREFKGIWDPAGKMNPHKVVDAYAVDENLRLGAGYQAARPETHFEFPDDSGSFGYATERCVGVGKCRKAENGTMCPSYMVTREEMHSTRGRAHLLFELLQGDVLSKNGWRDDSVKEALDLCLACKACKSECPVNVDVATYKAEFLAHYFDGRLRPRAAYSMGLIYWWSRLASLAPNLVNFFGKTPPFSSFVKWAGDIAPERKLPEFATVTFKEWFFQRGPRNQGQPSVLLWPDTFTNYFHPEIGVAAVDVLEDAGFQVILPRASLCCGRPLYDFGMLPKAKALLQDILEKLQPAITAGIPMVGLEPSCVAVFRDELHGLFPNDRRAQRLKEQTFTLAEFLEKHASAYAIPKLERHAIVHGHCHHAAIMKLNTEQRLYENMGLDFEMLDAGCCGMAGSFGFEKEKYSVSVQCGERVLLPRVREASSSTILIADGFSCREQIAQLSNRRAMHTAQVLQLALQLSKPGWVPEGSPHRNGNRALAGALAVAGAAAAGVALAHFLNQKRKP